MSGGFSARPSSGRARPRLRVALRLAARNARRSLGRSILIVAMMAIPVAGMSAAVVVVASSTPSDRELVDLHFADATAIMEVAGAPGEGWAQQVRAPIAGSASPAETPGEAEAVGAPVDPRDAVEGRVIAVSSLYSGIRSGDSIRQAEAIVGNVFVPELAGRYDLVEGAAPRGDGEIAINVAVADALSIEVGETVEVLATGEPATVTGIGRDAHADSSQLTFFGSPATLGLTDNADSAPFGTLYYALDATLDWDDVLALNERGIVATSPAVILGEGPFPGALEESPWSAFGLNGVVLGLAALIGGFLLVQVILLAGAAFMVGARQQQRSLAVMASVGAENRVLRSVVTANGVVLGVVGAVLGIGLGIGAAALVMLVTRNGSALQYPGFHLDPILLGVVGLAVIGSGWVAAAIPARVATRIDVVSALRGARRPVVARRGARRLAVAVTLVGVGSVLGGGLGLAVVRGLDEYPAELDVLSIMAIGFGAVVMQVGVLLALPSVLRALARIAARLGASVRLAARDTARNSGRTVPVAGAVMSTVFVATFTLTAIGAIEAENEQTWVFATPENSLVVPARSLDETSGLQVRDNLDEVVAGVAGIAEAPAVVVEGVPTVEFWGADPDTGAPVIPPAGSTSVIVLPNDTQVCPLNMPGAAPDAADTSDEWRARLADDPRCEDRVAQANIIGTGNSVVDTIRVGDREALEAAIGEPLSDEAIDALESGHAVATAPELTRDGEVTIQWLDAPTIAHEGLASAAHDPVRTTTIPAVVHSPSAPLAGSVLMAPATAERLGLEPTPGLVIAQPSFDVGQEHQDALAGLSESLTGDPWVLDGIAQRGPPDFLGPTIPILISATAAIALAASAIALGLARIDGRRDEAILGAVGATRMLRRASGFWQALLLAGLGSLVGTGLGVMAAGALALPGGPLPFAPPVVPLAIIGFVVPLAIALGAWIFAGRGAPLPTDRSAIA